MEYEELLEFVKTRRTIRAIKSDPLPDDTVQKLLEVARWAPTGFNMQPIEFQVITDLVLRQSIKEIVDDYKKEDLYPLENTREKWQGPVWALDDKDKWGIALAPVNILIMGDNRRRVGLPMAVRYTKQKCDSIFDSSLSNAFLYMWLAAHCLDLAVQPVSAVKYPRVQGFIKHLLNLPEYIEIYDMFLIGYSAMEGGPTVKLMRHLEEMTHYDRAADDDFLSEDELRKQIKKLRAGNMARHAASDKINIEFMQS